MSFGEKLAKLRKEKGLSQEELAQELNVSRQAVSKWESNNSYPETEKIIQICKLFDYSMDELIGLKDLEEKEDKGNENNLNVITFKNLKKYFKSLTTKEKIKKGLLFLFCGISLLVTCSIIAYFIFEFLFSSVFIYTEDYLIAFSFICLITSIYIFYKLYKNKKALKNNMEIKIEENQERDKHYEFYTDIKTILKKICLYCGKLIILFLIFPTVIIFVCNIGLLIFTSYYIYYGILLVFLAICLLATSVIIYLFLEILIKLLLDMELKFKRIFVMFMASLITFGVGAGLFVCEISTYKIIRYNDLLTSYNIDYSDDLIILELGIRNVVFENRDDIKIEYYGNPNFKFKVYDQIIERSNYQLFDPYLQLYMPDYSMNEYITNMLSSVKDKEIKFFDDSVLNYDEVIYMSRKNYEKLCKNEEKWRESIPVVG